MGWFSKIKDSVFGGSSDKSTASIPKYLETASKDLISRGTNLLNNDKYEAYNKPLVAGTNKYYDDAATAMKGQMGMVSGNMRQADAIADRTKAGTANYYNSVDHAIDKLKPLSGDYFKQAANASDLDVMNRDYYGKSAGAVDRLDSLNGDYFKDYDSAIGKVQGLGNKNFYGDADRAYDDIKTLGSKNYFGDYDQGIDSLKALTGDYFKDAGNNLAKIDRGSKAYSTADNLLDSGSAKFSSGMSKAQQQAEQAASRGNTTTDAIRKIQNLSGIVGRAQDSAEDIQLDRNAQLQRTLGTELRQSGTGYDEAAGLTRRASRLDSTNEQALRDRMNPYTNAVTKNAIRDYTKDRAVAEKGLNDAARMAGAFGGSRHGVAQGMFDQETSKQVADINTTQREKAYDAATGRLDADRSNLLSSASSLAGMQGQRDQGTLGFTTQMSDMAGRDASLLERGGQARANALKDEASAQMQGERQLYDMDSGSAKMLQDLASGYSSESQAMAKAKLDAQNQRFTQDMSYQDQMDELAKNRLGQQSQQFNQNESIVDKRGELAKQLLAQQEQAYNQATGKTATAASLADKLLSQQQQSYDQSTGIADLEGKLGTARLGQQNQQFTQDTTIADRQKAISDARLAQQQQRYD